MADEQSSAKSVISRRNFLKLAAGVLGVGLGGNAIYGTAWRAHQRENFGTVAQPAYAITAKLSRPDEFLPIEKSYPPFDIQHERQTAIISGLDEILSKAQKSNAVIEEQLEIFGKSSDLAVKRQALKLMKSHDYSVFAELQLGGLESQERIHDLVDPSSEELEGISELYKHSSLSNPRAVAKAVFKDLTGKELPSDVTFDHKALPKGFIGLHNEFSNRISTPGVEKVAELTTLIHEFGHAVAQHTEEHMPDYLSVLRGSRYDIGRLEEACAYAFADAGVCALYQKDPALGMGAKHVFEANLADMSVEFYKGDDSNEHFQAAALFIAARHCLKDPAKVFEVLSTVKNSRLENLPQEIKDRLSQDKAQYASVGDAAAIDRMVREKASAVGEHLDALAVLKERMNSASDAYQSALTPEQQIDEYFEDAKK